MTLRDSKRSQGTVEDVKVLVKDGKGQFKW